MNYNQKIYAFILNCEYHIVTQISKHKYGVVPLFTDSYGNEEVESDSLEKTIQLCKEKRWDVKEFDTYKQLFYYFLYNEESINSMDVWGIENITGRYFYIEEHGDKIQKFRDENGCDFGMKVPGYSLLR